MPEMSDPDRHKLGLLIHDVARLMRMRFQEKGNQYGLSSVQWGLLFRLMKEDGVPQARLAEFLEVEPISVSRMVDRMAENGWVVRRAGRMDRRVRMIHITQKAREACDSIRQISTSVYDEALLDMAEDERRVLVGALNKMAANLCATVSGGNGQTACP